MYTTRNFKTKKALKEAVEEYLDWLGRCTSEADQEACDRRFGVKLYAPGLGEPKNNGSETVEGPHYPAPHTWYASVEVKDGIVIKVK